MVNYCCIKDCKNTAFNVNIRFFRFPKEISRKQEWINALTELMLEVPKRLDNARICEVIYYVLFIFNRMKKNQFDDINRVVVIIAQRRYNPHIYYTDSMFF